jgi:hypothetical protein
MIQARQGGRDRTTRTTTSHRSIPRRHQLLGLFTTIAIFALPAADALAGI